MAKITLEDISFTYEGNIPALRNISLEFDQGTCYSIEGPNGCGKSTLFRILLGLSFPDSGRYLFDGEEINEKKLKQDEFSISFHKKIGFVFQNPEVQLFSKTVEDELAFGPRQLGISENEIRKKVDYYLELLKLTDLRDRAPFYMSGGEKKRCALASVLIMEPGVLILDEPLNGLDEENEEFLLSFLKELKSDGRLIIFSTHRKDVALAFADRRIFITKEHRIANT
ncbi:MAG: ABC transporter ATP-binding protein [Catonella sp.]|nr:ABC transporter ATP-binding protein [Catonella sp.]MDY6355685.1 ABC transporter ATP-binding protein [Catonella sp.]